MMGGFGGSMGGTATSKAKRPINVKFEIPYFTTSGIQVRYLKIIEPKVCLTPVTLCRREEQVALHGLLRKGNADMCADFLFCLVAIPQSPLGEIYHAVGRHRGPVTGCRD